MKLRQKLAAVLAATMVVTAVPVVTMASSDNKLTNSVAHVKQDAGVDNYGKLKIELEDEITSGSMFFITLNGAEWADSTFAADVAGQAKLDNGALSATITRTSDKEVQVVFTANIPTAATNKVITLPIEANVKEAEATIAIDGGNTTISDMKETVFAVSDAQEKATVKFPAKDDIENIKDSGKVGDITIEEPYKGVLNTKENKITFELEDTDYKFDDSNIGAGNFVFSKGLSDYSIGTGVTISYNNDKTELYLNFASGTKSANVAGRIEAKDLPIMYIGEDDEKVDNEIEITVDGKDIKKTTGVVAQVKDYGVGLEMDDKKVVEMTAGTEEEITFTVKENVKETMATSRTVEVRLEKGYFLPKERGSKSGFYAGYEDISSPSSSETAAYTIPSASSKITINPENSGDTAQVKDWIWEDDRAVGFKLEFNALGSTSLHEFTFEDVKVYMPVDVEGDVKVKMEGRGIDNVPADVVALKVKKPITVTSESMIAKVGLKDQKGGKLVIKETDAAMLKQGEVIKIAIDGYDKDKLDGLRFDDEPEVKVTEGDIELDVDNITQKNGYIEIKVKRDSKKASTIELTNFAISADRSVPEGNYDVLVNGKAVAPDCALEDITVEKFIQVNTPNTEDQGNGGLAKGTTSFVIGANKYVVNGLEKEMDAAAYVSKAGRTMVPVKYLADAFGVDAKNVIFSNGTVTIIAANRTVQIKNNSNVAVVNGVAMTMDEKMVIKNGRSYAPASQIGNILGVTPKWDGATQTASFTN